ncbi:MAG: PLP-dependent aminotransferase family protein [Rickettsiales bacterium]|nr:PLP-dependent aminotransferase family protein [Rickettsiales bacterium]
MSTQFISEYSKNLKKSEIQEALQRSVSPDIISFALGMPDTSLLPLAKYKEAFEAVISSSCLQYSPPLKTLRTQIVTLMRERQVLCSENQVFLTSGAQQAMLLISKLLISKGDNVIIDEATYPGFIQIAKSLEANLIPIPVDLKKGIIVGELEKKLKIPDKPKFIYTIPDGHNPLGISLSKRKRIELIDIAQSYKIPLVEDDAYGFINYEHSESPLRAYCDQSVFYIGSFSKILSPATRIGWLIVPEYLIEKLEILKEGMDINTATLAQYIMSTYIDMKHLNTHLSIIRNHYKEKRNIMVEALRKYIPEMQFNIPSSGFFIWGMLPDNIKIDRVFKQALEVQKVSFLPGTAFTLDKKSNLANCLRLSFAFCHTSLLETGIKRLRDAILESMK